MAFVQKKALAISGPIQRPPNNFLVLDGWEGSTIQFFDTQKKIMILGFFASRYCSVYLVDHFGLFFYFGNSITESHTGRQWK